MARTRAALASLALATVAPAAACGYCDEDRMAAVYSHEAVTRAFEQEHRIAFFAIAGPLPPAVAARRMFVGALAPVKGIDPRSLRVSVDAASLSLSYDATRVSPEQLRDLLNRKLEARGVSVALLKVMAQRAAAR